MSILVCAATSLEIQPTIDHIRSSSLAGAEVLITGVGLTAACYSLTRAILTKKPRLILQAGVAGALDPSLDLAETVLVKSETIGDLGVEEGSFRSVFDLQLLNRDEFPWTNGRLINEHALLQEGTYRTVSGVSVNEISTNPARIEYYRELGMEIESMEGAALHYAALQEQVPFLQIRSLSNFAAERDKGKWKMEQAIRRLNEDLQKLLNKFLRP